MHRSVTVDDIGPTPLCHVNNRCADIVTYDILGLTGVRGLFQQIFIS